jgi:hypothetical protein
MMTRAQKELTGALVNLTDSKGGVVAQVESANNRLTQSLEKRENALDALLQQLNTYVLYVWIPLISAAALSVGLIAGMAIRGCMDSVTAAATAPRVVQSVPTPETQENSRPAGTPKQQHHSQVKAGAGAQHERWRWPLSLILNASQRIDTKNIAKSVGRRAVVYPAVGLAGHGRCVRTQ